LPIEVAYQLATLLECDIATIFLLVKQESQFRGLENNFFLDLLKRHGPALIERERFRRVVIDYRNVVNPKDRPGREKPRKSKGNKHVEKKDTKPVNEKMFYDIRSDQIIIEDPEEEINLLSEVEFPKLDRDIQEIGGAPGSEKWTSWFNSESGKNPFIGNRKDTLLELATPQIVEDDPFVKYIPISTIIENQKKKISSLPDVRINLPKNLESPIRFIFDDWSEKTVETGEVPDQTSFKSNQVSPQINVTTKPRQVDTYTPYSPTYVEPREVIPEKQFVKPVDDRLKEILDYEFPIPEIIIPEPVPLPPLIDLPEIEIPSFIDVDLDMTTSKTRVDLPRKIELERDIDYSYLDDILKVTIEESKETYRKEQYDREQEALLASNQQRTNVQDDTINPSYVFRVDSEHVCYNGQIYSDDDENILYPEEIEKMKSEIKRFTNDEDVRINPTNDVDESSDIGDEVIDPELIAQIEDWNVDESPDTYELDIVPQIEAQTRYFGNEGNWQQKWKMENYGLTPAECLKANADKFRELKLQMPKAIPATWVDVFYYLQMFPKDQVTIVSLFA